MASNSVGIDSSKDSSSRKSVSKRKEPDAKKRRFPKEVSAPSPTRLPEASNTPSQPIDSNSVATEGEVGSQVDTLMEVDDIDEFFLDGENEQGAADKDELDMYLEELNEKYVPEFELLGWWKTHSVRFPCLSCVAKDVLAIQSSTVASESAFSTGGRTLDRFRSSLTPTTAEVIICLQDWMRNSKQPIGVEELIADMEKIELGAIEDPEIRESVLQKTAFD